MNLCSLHVPLVPLVLSVKCLENPSPSHLYVLFGAQVVDKHLYRLSRFRLTDDMTSIDSSVELATSSSYDSVALSLMAFQKASLRTETFQEIPECVNDTRDGGTRHGPPPASSALRAFLGQSPSSIPRNTSYLSIYRR